MKRIPTIIPTGSGHHEKKVAVPAKMNIMHAKAKPFLWWSSFGYGNDIKPNKISTLAIIYLKIIILLPGKNTCNCNARTGYYRYKNCPRHTLGNIEHDFYNDKSRA